MNRRSPRSPRAIVCRSRRRQRLVEIVLRDQHLPIGAARGRRRPRRSPPTAAAGASPGSRACPRRARVIVHSRWKRRRQGDRARHRCPALSAPPRSCRCDPAPPNLVLASIRRAPDRGSRTSVRHPAPRVAWSSSAVLVARPVPRKRVSRYRRSSMWCPVRSALAAIVSEGLTPPARGSALPSVTYRFSSPRNAPHSSSGDGSRDRAEPDGAERVGKRLDGMRVRLERARACAGFFVRRE